MELRVKEICKMRGMTMGALADRMGVDLSNLSASIKGNPTLERLKDIAKNLGVEVYDLFPKPTESSGILGLVDINGERLKITTADEWVEATQKIPGLIKLPVYQKDSDLIKAIGNFVHEGIKTQTDDSMFGQLGRHEIFCISRTARSEYVNDEEGNIDDMVFTLSVLGSKWTREYSQMEYSIDGKCDIDGDLGIVMSMRNEIEACFDSCESV